MAIEDRELTGREELLTAIVAAGGVYAVDSQFMAEQSTLRRVLVGGAVFICSSLVLGWALKKAQLSWLQVD